MRLVCEHSTLIAILQDILIKWSDPDFTTYATKRIQYSIHYSVTRIDCTNIIGDLLSEFKYGGEFDTIVLLLNEGI